MRHIHYLGTDFEVWTGERIWFWRLSEGDAIGVTATEAAAVSEACASIEEHRSKRKELSTTSRRCAATAQSCQSGSMTIHGWESLLANFEMYLSCISAAATDSAAN